MKKIFLIVFLFVFVAAGIRIVQRQNFQSWMMEHTLTMETLVPDTSINQVVAQFAKYLSGHGDTAFWTSPLCRATNDGINAVTQNHTHTQLSGENKWRDELVAAWRSIISDFVNML